MKFRIVFPISFCPMGRPQRSRPVQWVVFSRLMERIPRYYQRLHQVSLKVQIILEETNYFSMIACFFTEFSCLEVNGEIKIQTLVVSYWYGEQKAVSSPYSRIFVNNEIAMLYNCVSFLVNFCSMQKCINRDSIYFASKQGKSQQDSIHYIKIVNLSRANKYFCDLEQNYLSWEAILKNLVHGKYALCQGNW